MFTSRSPKAMSMNRSATGYLPSKSLSLYPSDTPLSMTLLTTERPLTKNICPVLEVLLMAGVDMYPVRRIFPSEYPTGVRFLTSMEGKTLDTMFSLSPSPDVENTTLPLFINLKAMSSYARDILEIKSVMRLLSAESFFINFSLAGVL